MLHVQFSALSSYHVAHFPHHCPMEMSGQLRIAVLTERLSAASKNLEMLKTIDIELEKKDEDLRKTRAP